MASLSSKPGAAGGRALVRRYGDFYARQAQEAWLNKRLAADGLDRTKMSPELLNAYRLQQLRLQMEAARAALALKRSLHKAEMDAERAAARAAKARQKADEAEAEAQAAAARAAIEIAAREGGAA